MGFTMPRREKIHNPDIPNGLPEPPRNVFTTNPYQEGKIDIRWDDPASIGSNVSQFKDILGVNIYRSFNGSQGPWDLVNSEPIGGLNYRDSTQNIFVDKEDVTKQFISKGRGAEDSSPFNNLSFETQNKPIVKNDETGSLARDFNDVEVTFTDESGETKTATVAQINPLEGIIHLNTKGYLDPVSSKIVEPKVPDLDNSATKVYCNYWYNTVILDTDIVHKIFYKLTTVAMNTKGNRVETPLEFVNMVDAFETEKMDWMWREAVRRNRWILEQGGERVKILIRKWNGEPCPCLAGAESEFHPDSTCTTCFGTGIVNGYEGPYDVIIPPPDTERQIPITEKGYRLVYQYDCWTGPTPRLTERDIVVKQNNERYILGPVTPVIARGVTLQQSFALQYIEPSDIRYKVPIWGTLDNPNQKILEDGTRIQETVGNPDKISEAQEGKSNTRESQLSPYLTKHNSKDDNDQQKGRTGTFENITY